VFLCTTVGIPGFLNIFTDPFIKIGSDYFFIDVFLLYCIYFNFQSDLIYTFKPE